MEMLTFVLWEHGEHSESVATIRKVLEYIIVGQIITSCSGYENFVAKPPHLQPIKTDDWLLFPMRIIPI